jgi:glycogen(starch) synthase
MSLRVLHVLDHSLLVGGEPRERALKSLAALRVADKVGFVGRMPHREVQHYYSIVDVFAYGAIRCG